MSRVPVGYITLQEAFEALIKRLPFGEFAAPREFDDSSFDCLGRKHNEVLYESLKTLLSNNIGGHSERLEILYWHPDHSEPDRMLPEHWRNGWWPERNFLAGECNSPASDTMSRYNGYILITRREPFEAWVSAVCSKDISGLEGAKQTMAAETQCARWLEREFQKLDTASTSKAAFKAKVQATYTGLGSNAFERAWIKATESYPERRLPGAKKKSVR